MENEKFQDLVLEHLARLTQEITEIKQGQQELKTDVTSLKEGQQELQAQVTKIETRLENEVIDKIKILFDARQADRETLERLERKVDVIADQVANHEVQIKVIKPKPLARKK